MQLKITSYFLCFNPIQHTRTLIENRIYANYSGDDPRKAPESAMDKFSFTAVVKVEKNSSSIYLDNYTNL